MTDPHMRKAVERLCEHYCCDPENGAILAVTLHSPTGPLAGLYAEIEALKQERDAALADLGRVRSDLRAALCEISAQARARGEAEGRLRLSEMAGIVEGWHARAKAAEVRIAELEGVIQMVIQDADEHMRRVGIRPALLCPKAEALARALLSPPAPHPQGGEDAR